MTHHRYFAVNFVKQLPQLLKLVFHIVFIPGINHCIIFVKNFKIVKKSVRDNVF